VGAPARTAAARRVRARAGLTRFAFRGGAADDRGLMATDEGKPTATVLRIKVRHGDLDTFVERFANQVTRAGVFIPTRTPKPVGTEVRFEIRLADDRPVLVGQGPVRLVRPHDPARPRVVAGMAVELQRVGRDSRDVLLRMLEVRKRRGFVDGPGGMPLPGDEPAEDTAASETTAVRRAPRPSVPVPIAAAFSEPVPVPMSDAGSVPIAVIAPPPPPPPRAPTMLAPVASRTRVRLDVAALAAAPPTNDVLDDDLQAWAEAQVPLEQVVARARALVGDDLDGELAAIVAAPMPVIDRDTAQAAATQAGAVAPRRARRERLAPLSRVPPSAPDATDAGSLLDDRPTPIPSPLPTGVAAPATATALERAAAIADEAERAQARARAAERASRERARREANDRALLERSERIRRETAERDRLRTGRPAVIPPPPAPSPPPAVRVDPLAQLDLDEPIRKPPTPPRGRRKTPDETTRKVDAAALAAEALDASALRASLADVPDPDLGFLDSLSLDEPGRKPAHAPRPAHTVPRSPRPPAVIPAARVPQPEPRKPPGPTRPAPAVPVPSDAVDLDLDDDHEIEIQIEHDES